VSSSQLEPTIVGHAKLEKLECKREEEEEAA
jgi:hypothetical protein